MKLLRLAVAASAFAASAAFAQTKWDLPAAYSATNFHSENLVQFANDVDTATGGKLKITVHANASLFKAPEIKRAVQGDQAQLGEILLVELLQRESDLRSRRPAFPGHRLRRRDEAVQGAEAAAREEARVAGNDAALLGAVAARRASTRTAR